MDPLTLMLIGGGVSALSSIPQWLTGDTQEKKASEMEKNLVRPKMVMPSGYTEALNSAKTQAGMTRLPGQSAIEGRLDQTTANTLAMLERTTTGGPELINAAGRVYGNQMEKENELGVSAANMYLHNQDILRNELHNYGTMENELWKVNELDPYQQKAIAVQALKEGAIRNKDAAWKNLFGVAGNTLMGIGMSGKGGGNWWDKFIGSDSSISSSESGSGRADLGTQNILDRLSSFSIPSIPKFD